MLTFCGFLILMLIGFMFVKEDNKKKMIKIIKDNFSLIGAGLVLLFLINSISGFSSINDSFSSINDSFSSINDSFSSINDSFSKLIPESLIGGKKEIETFDGEGPPKSTCGP